MISKIKSWAKDFCTRENESMEELAHPDVRKLLEAKNSIENLTAQPRQVAEHIINNHIMVLNLLVLNPERNKEEIKKQIERLKKDFAEKLLPLI